MNNNFDTMQSKKIAGYEMYIMDTAAFEDDGIFNACLSRVSEYRRTKVVRLRRREDRNSSLAAGLLLAYALKLYAGVDESRLTYTRSRSGKLFADIENQYIQFSISHTEGCVAVVIGCSKCGVDVERVRRIPDNIVRRIFSDKDIRTIDASNHPKVYGTYVWTRREAYSKLTGTGILMNDESQKLVTDDEYMSGLNLRMKSYGVKNTHPYECVDFAGLGGLFDSEDTDTCAYIASVCTDRAENLPLHVKMIDSSDIVCYYE